MNIFSINVLRSINVLNWGENQGKYKTSLKRLGEKHTNVLKIRENITIISILQNIKIFEN